MHTSQGGVEELRSEFTKRIGTTEKKLQTIVKVNTFDDVIHMQGNVKEGCTITTYRRNALLDFYV